MLRQASPAYACRSCRTLGVFVPRMRKLPCRPCGSTLGRPLVACVAFGWSRLLQLLTFISFVIPLAVAYLATELSRAYGLWSTSFTAVIALLEASFTYVSCVFAIADPRVLQVRAHAHRFHSQFACRLGSRLSGQLGFRSCSPTATLRPRPWQASCPVRPLIWLCSARCSLGCYSSVSRQYANPSLRCFRKFYDYL